MTMCCDPVRAAVSELDLALTPSATPSDLGVHPPPLCSAQVLYAAVNMICDRHSLASAARACAEMYVDRDEYVHAGTTCGVRRAHNIRAVSWRWRRSCTPHDGLSVTIALGPCVCLLAWLSGWLHTPRVSAMSAALFRKALFSFIVRMGIKFQRQGRCPRCPKEGRLYALIMDGFRGVDFPVEADSPQRMVEVRVVVCLVVLGGLCVVWMPPWSCTRQHARRV